MSRRSSHNSNNRHHPPEWSNTSSTNNNNNNYRYSPKTQRKFVPKTQSLNPNPTQTLSSSLRQSDAAPSSSSRDKGGGNFVNYLLQDEAVASGLGAEEGGLDPVESQRVVDLLNRELSRLLKSSPRDFWREVATDTSLHEFLDSFLKFRSRWYDFPYRGVKGTVAGVIVGELELSRRVFMVLYRLSSNRDPGARAADALSSKDHAVLLQEKKLLDIPKLLDICGIYGHENEELTGLLVRNALKAQPGIHDNFTAIMSHFLGIAHTMYQRCISSLEALFSTGTHKDHESSPLLTDFLEVMDFINDAIVCMDAFVTAYKLAAVFFSCPMETSYGNEELLITLARLHDTLLPSLDRGFRIILKGQDGGMVSNISVSLKMLSMRLVTFGWKLLNICYLSDEVFESSLPVPAVTKMFPATIEDPAIRADILIQTLREINGVLLYAQGNQNWNTFLQNLDRSYHIRSQLQNLNNAGWILMDEEQLHYLSGLMMSSLESSVKEPAVLPMPPQGNKVIMDEDAAILESKVSQIKDLFPDYGKGFLAACLEVYNQNPEEVIQRILEGTLHEDLLSLDTSSETKPIPKSASTSSTKDKGKGKLIESEPITKDKGKGKLDEPEPRHLTMPFLSNDPVVGGNHPIERIPVSSSSSIGRFVRKSDNMPDHYATGSRNAEDVARTATLISQFEYEDEYDDSFDDLGLTVTDSGLEESEILGGKISSGLVMSSGRDGENAPQTVSDAKWGSRRKPQFFVKDGKNYSYKVAGSVAVANSMEASLVNQAQGELIYGLGRGGNIPLGAVRKLNEYQEHNNQHDEPEMVTKGSLKNSRGRGRKGVGMVRESQEHPDDKSDDCEVEGKGTGEHPRARGRGRGRGSNNYRKDRAMKKHFAGISGV